LGPHPGPTVTENICTHPTSAAHATTHPTLNTYSTYNTHTHTHTHTHVFIDNQQVTQVGKYNALSDNTASGHSRPSIWQRVSFRTVLLPPTFILLHFFLSAASQSKISFRTLAISQVFAISNTCYFESVCYFEHLLFLNPISLAKHLLFRVIECLLCI
jgi:hypothetical protein